MSDHILQQDSPAREHALDTPLARTDRLTAACALLIRWMIESGAISQVEQPEKRADAR